MRDMTRMKDLLHRLTESSGPSGNENEVRALIHEEIRDLVDDIRVDVMGNLLATRKGPGQHIMLSAHMDEIGIVVTHVDDKGFLRFGGVGGLDPVTLIGQRVAFANGTLGVIGSEKRESAREEVKIERLYLDIGAKDKNAALHSANVGDMGTFVREFREVDGRFVAKSMDDRVGCALLIESLREVGNLPNSVTCAFTVQEEVGLRGATTSAFQLAPDLALAVDVTTTGDTPEAHRMPVSLGAGPAIKIKDRGMLTNPAVKKLLIDTARAQGIPFQLEVLDLGTTDASAIQVSRAGVLTGAISIPCRYVHSTSEMVDPADVDGALALIQAIISKELQLPTPQRTKGGASQP